MASAVAVADLSIGLPPETLFAPLNSYRLSRKGNRSP
jgi:hypothetical protein